jgi:hypothetical protein
MSIRYIALYFDLLLDLLEAVRDEYNETLDLGTKEERAHRLYFWARATSCLEIHTVWKQDHGQCVSSWVQFFQELESCSEVSPRAYAICALVRTSFKKFQDEIPPGTDDVALQKFLSANDRCKAWELRVETLEDELLVGLFKQQVYRFFNPGSAGGILSDISAITHAGTVGPGTSSGSKGTDFYTKMFSGPLTSTRKGLHTLYEHHIQNIPFWGTGEEARAFKFGDVEVVEGNRLSFVPKNVNTSRAICTEPLLNMFFQQGTKYILEKRLKKSFGIDLANQQLCNRDLAQLGSLFGDFCTIDLESASDSVSLRMIRELFPKDVSQWLEFIRSPRVQLPNQEWVELGMISSMGNAFTFPLETIIFACVVSAAYEAGGKPLVKGYSVSCEETKEDSVIVNTRRLPNFGVFGDDIIVSKAYYRKVVRLLDLLGFTVNAEKSFSEGPFRESCGGDYFSGHSVRGIYLKSLRSMASRYVAFNRLNYWSAKHDVKIGRTISRLYESCRYLPVPLYENDDAGLKLPLDMVKTLKKDLDCQSTVYKRWQAIPQKIAIVDGALKLPKGQKSRIYNADGLLVAMLRGDVRNGTIGSRLGPVRYRSKEAVSPSWDWLPTVGLKDPIGQWRLTSAIRQNLQS